MKRFFSLLTILTVALNLFSNEERQTRRVVIDQEWNCSYERANELIDLFVLEMQTDMNHLFTWAFMGTENKGDTKGKDAVSIKYVSNTYDPETRTGVLVTTIEVLGVPWFKNREVGSVYRDSVVAGTRYARLEITYSGSLLQAANGQFHTTPVDANHTKVHFELNIVLGRFFSAFVSNKTWNEVAAWRVQTIVNNVREYAETGTVKKKE